MKHPFFLTIAALSALASCNGEYADWATPAANQQQEPAAATVLTVQPLVQSTIDFAQTQPEQLQLFSSNLPAGSAAEYTVSLASGADGVQPQQIIADAEGNINTADLQAAVETLYGKAPTERTLTAVVAANVKVDADGYSIVLPKTAEPFALKAKLDAPFIDKAYYIVGGALDWAASAADKSQKFQHSDAGVYDDPVFSCTFPCATGDTWFAIGSETACDAVVAGDWSQLHGVPAGTTATGEWQALDLRSNMGKDNSLCLPAGPKYAHIDINMLESKYLLTPIESAYYLIGDYNSWNGDAMQAFTDNGDGTFSITVTVGDGSYWKVIPQSSVDAGNIWGQGVVGTPTDGNTDATAPLTVNNPGSAKIPTAGTYTITLDFPNWTYKVQ